MPKHGEYQPGRGFYDASRRGWITDPAKLTQTRSSNGPIHQGHRDQVASWGHAPAFQPIDQYERLLKLRDSDRREDRENYQKMVAGPLRMTLSEYEGRRRTVLEAGDYNPDGA